MGASVGPAADPMISPDACPRCGSRNAPHMKFCGTCGSGLAPPPDAVASSVPVAPPGAAPVAPRPAVPPASARRSAPHPAAGGPGEQATEPGTCSSCGELWEPGARFCKFCGAQAELGPSTARQSLVSAAAPSPAGPRTARVVVIHRDGSEGGSYSLEGTKTDIGNREGDIVITDDPYMSPRHARIERINDTYILRDLGSVNGIYVRIGEPIELRDRDMFLIGQQVLRFEIVPEPERRVGAAKQHGVMIFGTPDNARLARVVQYGTDGLERDVYYLDRDETVFGREQADVVFAEDPFLSRRHAVISMDRSSVRFQLRDLGSSNGTALRCRSEWPLKHGEQFRVGRHLFRFDLAASVGNSVGNSAGQGAP